MTENLRKVINTLLNEFTKEEVGNRVTSNNMAGLQMKLMMALDGKITLKPPGDGAAKPTEPVSDESPTEAPVKTSELH